LAVVVLSIHTLPHGRGFASNLLSLGERSVRPSPCPARAAAAACAQAARTGQGADSSRDADWPLPSVGLLPELSASCGPASLLPDCGPPSHACGLQAVPAAGPQTAEGRRHGLEAAGMARQVGTRQTGRQFRQRRHLGDRLTAAQGYGLAVREGCSYQQRYSKQSLEFLSSD
jgi:hypothetical protein